MVSKPPPGILVHPLRHRFFGFTHPRHLHETPAEHSSCYPIHPAKNRASDGGFNQLNQTLNTKTWKKYPPEKTNIYLVGGWTNPFEKYARRDENEKYLKPPTRYPFPKAGTFLSRWVSELPVWWDMFLLSLENYWLKEVEEKFVNCKIATLGSCCWFVKRWFTLSKNDSAEIPRYPYSGSVTSNQKSNLEAPQYELFRSTWESLKQPNQQQQPLTMCQYLAFHETQHPLKHCDPPTFLASQMYCFLFLGLGMPQLKVTNPETGWYLANTFTFTVRPSFW